MVVAEMLRARIPWPLILIVLLLGWTANVGHGPIGYAEFFAGQAEQSKAFEGVGLRGHTHDIKNGRHYDICGDSGFALAVNSICRLLPGSIAPMGPTCSSWIFLSRSTSGRPINFIIL